jgi:hypothetical protein
MENERCDVALVGGVLNAGELVLGPMRSTIMKVAPKAVLVSPRFNATIGAALLALRDVGSELNEALLSKISESARRLALL